MEVDKGGDLPGGGKLPNKTTFKRLAEKKATGASFNFTNGLLVHQKECDGEVKLASVVLAH